MAFEPHYEILTNGVIRICGCSATTDHETLPSSEYTEQN